MAASATASSSMKILTIGPPQGQVNNVIQKISAIESKHGPFHALFVTGDFFASSSSLTNEETDLLDGKIKLPIRTYISQATKRPAKEINLRLKALRSSGSSSSSNLVEDQRPIPLADNLYWLEANQVSWVPKDGQFDEQAAEDDGNGLRVAVCAGKWDATKWAQEVTGSKEDEAADTTATEGQEEEEDYLLPSSLERLYLHPAFQPPKTAENAPTAAVGQISEPQTLAAARARLQAQQQAASSTLSSEAKPPAIDILILPTWPSGITLFSKSFPPKDTPEEARTWGLPPIAEVMRRARPRYAFAVTPDKEAASTLPTEANDSSEQQSWGENGVFWEREPYSTPTSLPPQAMGGRGEASGANAVVAKRRLKAPDRITRFISLANFSNPGKVRWFLALNLSVGEAEADASKAALTVKGATPSPFGAFLPVMNGSAGKRKADEGQDAADEGLSSAVNFRWQAGGAKKQRRQAGDNGSHEKDDGPPPAGYVCRICGSQEHYIRLCPHKTSNQPSSSGSTGNRPISLGLPNRPKGAEEALGPRRPPVEMVGPKDCWFCLSNEGCAKHLVVAIGNEAYLALPKGQLPSSSSDESPVPGGGHVLIVPIQHLTSPQDASSPEKLSLEIEAYIEALSKCYAAHGCITVVSHLIKLSNTRAGHFQIQVVPVPEEQILAKARMQPGETNGEGKDFVTFLEAAASQRGYILERVEDEGKKIIGSRPKGQEYFQMDVISTTSGRQAFTVDLGSSGSPRFEFQFPRKTLAAYMGVPDRADWRVCARSDRVEEVETKEFRGAFEEWMPQFEEDDDDEDDDDDDDE